MTNFDKVFPTTHLAVSQASFVFQKGVWEMFMVDEGEKNSYTSTVIGKSSARNTNPLFDTHHAPP